MLTPLIKVKVSLHFWSTAALLSFCEPSESVCWLAGSRLNNSSYPFCNLTIFGKCNSVNNDGTLRITLKNISNKNQYIRHMFIQSDLDPEHFCICYHEKCL